MQPEPAPPRPPSLWDRLRAGITRPIDRIDCARAHTALYSTLMAGARLQGGQRPPERAVAAPAD